MRPSRWTGGRTCGPQPAAIVVALVMPLTCTGVLQGLFAPKILWTVHLDGCIESTPAVWYGMLWVGARGGQFYGIGDPGGSPIKP